MRTEDSTPLAPTMAQLRPLWLRLRRAVLGRGSATRVFAVLGVLAAIGLAAYLANNSPTAGKYLGGGRPYSADELAKITRELDAKHIEYRIDDRRIGVPSDRFDTAADLVAKLNIGPPSIPDLRKEIQKSSFWDSPAQAEQRELHAREQILEAMIRHLDGIVSAYVTINRIPVRGGLRPATTATAFVWLETEGDVELTSKTVQAVQEIVVGNVNDLKADAVTVCDQKGHIYLVAHDKASAAISKSKAREEELAAKLLEELEWIKGVRVTVQLVPAPAPPPAAPPVPRTPEPPASPEVAVNQPLSNEPPPPPPPADDPVPAPPKPPEPDAAKIWVRIPRSYYFEKASPNPNPSPEDLQPIVTRTASLVRTAVELSVPSSELGELKIDTIPDNVVMRNPTVAPAVPETRRALPWWVPAAVGGAFSAGLAIVLLVLVAARRPRRSPRVIVPEPDRLADEDEEAGPGPSERVRELIRRNPEAAASVLHRWIGQGGEAA